MPKIIYLSAALLAFSLQGVTRAAELTQSIDDSELNNLKQELCNNPEVTQILTNNTLDELYVPPTTGVGDDDDGNTALTTAQPISEHEVFILLCS